MDLEADDLDVKSWLVAAGRPTEPGAPLNQPIMPASNFVLGEGRIYARDTGTPTWEALEELVGGLEGGGAVAFSSGMAAAAAVFHQIPTGSRLVLPPDCYQGVLGLARDGERRGMWEVELIEVDDTDAWIAATPTADLIWLESPSNPMLTVADLETICAATRKPGSILCVDNTFATPLNQQPLDLGADISMQSATKLIGGHSDLLIGVLTTRDDQLLEHLRETRIITGALPGSLESFLALRGARTLALRLERAQANAAILAERLDAHPAVGLVRYPGFGTIISFDVAGGAEAADRACKSIRLISHATSLGAVDSTMERRAGQPGQEHIPPGMIRFSVGIEDVDDLWRDLEGALA